MNPADPRRLPGGSSSGSAVAVAAGEADVALGTDTGGSVRIPAACCGIAGLKTTWGRVPLDGVYPLAPSLDTVGPLGADVAAVELGMRPDRARLRRRVLRAPTSGRMRPEVDVDPLTDAAVDAALAAAGLRVTDVDRVRLPGRRSAPANVLIDAEAYQANAHLIPHLDRLTPQHAAQHDRVGRDHRRSGRGRRAASGGRRATGSPPRWTATRSWPCRRWWARRR